MKSHGVVETYCVSTGLNNKRSISFWAAYAVVHVLESLEYKGRRQNDPLLSQSKER